MDDAGSSFSRDRRVSRGVGQEDSQGKIYLGFVPPAFGASHGSSSSKRPVQSIESKSHILNRETFGFQCLSQ